MTRVSKYFVDSEVKREMDVAFQWLISKLNKDKNVAIFLNDFLTEEENIMLAKRLFVGYLIAKGLNYLEICDLLKVSSATVGKAKEWLTRRPGYRATVKMLIDHQKSIEFDKNLERILRRIFPQSKADWSRLQGTSDFPD